MKYDTEELKAAQQSGLSRRALLAGTCLSALAAALPLAGCAAGGDSDSDTVSEEVSEQQNDPNISQAGATFEDPLEQKIYDTVSSMTLEEKIYQLFMVTPEALTGVGQVIQAGDATRAALEAKPVAGLIYFASNIQGAGQLRDMLSGTAQMATVSPLFLGVDEEGGSLVARVANSGYFKVETFPDMYEIGAGADPDEAAYVGTTIGTYLREIGFNLDFAPVADVLTNPDSSIGVRAFSSDAEVCARMVQSEVEALQACGISACAKHFPGHGDVSADSHTGEAISLRSLDELRSCEFLPFRAAIEAGVDFIMVGHITTPNAAADGVPASLSRVVMTEWLRDELGFEGVITSDALNMGAVTQYYPAGDAAVEFLRAGGDLVLMPADFGAAVAAVAAAVENQELSEARIDESLWRILRIKLR